MMNTTGTHAGALHEFAIPFGELDVTESSIVRALGYESDIPAPVTGIIRSVIPTLETVMEARGGFRMLGGVRVSAPEGILFCGDTAFAVDKIIAAQFHACDAMAVFAVTAGIAIERWSKERMDDGDMLAGYILDVIGSDVAEAAAQWMEEKVDAFLRPQGLGSTVRYSPGYCGWQVSEQQKLFSFFPENFCGISLTESSLMLPIKSVSGIIGIGASVKKEIHRCSACDDNDCLHRN